MSEDGEEIPSTPETLQVFPEDQEATLYDLDTLQCQLVSMTKREIAAKAGEFQRMILAAQHADERRRKERNNP